MNEEDWEKLRLIVVEEAKRHREEIMERKILDLAELTKRYSYTPSIDLPEPMQASYLPGWGAL